MASSTAVTVPKRFETRRERDHCKVDLTSRRERAALLQKHGRPAATIKPALPYFICPNCKRRVIDSDRREGLTTSRSGCSACGFGFLFELLEDYYPGPNTGFVVCDADLRILAVGRGILELTGFPEQELFGKTIAGRVRREPENGDDPAALAVEWGVRRLDQPLDDHDALGNGPPGDGRLLPRLRRGRRPARRARRPASSRSDGLAPGPTMSRAQRGRPSRLSRFFARPVRDRVLVRRSPSTGRERRGRSGIRATGRRSRTMSRPGSTSTFE